MMKRTKKKRRRNLHAHFTSRLASRYNMLVSEAEIMGAVEKIRRGESIHLSDLSNRVSNHIVMLSGVNLTTMEDEKRLVAMGYDRQRKSLTTALPDTLVKEYVKRLQNPEPEPHQS